MDAMVKGLLIDQIAHEFRNALLYLGAYNYFTSMALDGFAKLMWSQYTGELEHAQKINEYLNDRLQIFELQHIPSNPSLGSSPVDVFTAAYARERETTSRLMAIDSAAREANDRQTQIFLEWFLAEQIEEEKTTSDWLMRLRVENASLFVLDEKAADQFEG